MPQRGFDKLHDIPSTSETSLART